MNKTAELLKLARKRRKSRWPGYNNLGDYHGGIYDCDHVSPYTKSAGNIEADLMIFLLDWSSDARLRGPIDWDAVKLGYTPSLPTNIKLITLLPQHFGLSLEDTYATNLFPFIKQGAMKAPIPAKDMLRAAIEFGLSQLEIIRPKIAVSLGIATFNALRRACGLRSVGNIDEGIRSPFKYGESMLWCQAHTGQLGLINRNRGGVDRVSQDWVEMARDYAKLTRR